MDGESGSGVAGPGTRSSPRAAALSKQAKGLAKSGASASAENSTTMAVATHGSVPPSSSKGKASAKAPAILARALQTQEITEVPNILQLMGRKLKDMRREFFVIDLVPWHPHPSGKSPGSDEGASMHQAMVAAGRTRRSARTRGAANDSAAAGHRSAGAPPASRGSHSNASKRPSRSSRSSSLDRERRSRATDLDDGDGASGGGEEERLSCDFFDTRHGFLRMCQTRNF